MAEHTPTPWTYEAKGGKGSWIAGSNKEWSALSCGNKHETADANAEFIVRAVNTHDALVKALEEASAILSATVTAGRLSEGDDFNFTGKWSHLGRIRLGKVLDAADAALALSEQHEKTGGAQ